MESRGALSRPALVDAIARGSVTGKEENVRRKRDAGVEPDDVRQRVSIVDAEERVYERKRGVELIEEAIAVPQGLELLLPDRELELPELGALEVLLGHHADERVDRVHVAVDRLEPSSERGAANADDDLVQLLGRSGRHDVSIRVG